MYYLQNQNVSRKTVKQIETTVSDAPNVREEKGNEPNTNVQIPEQEPTPVQPIADTAISTTDISSL
jgi:hypothetical protein